ncbi:triple tyrosine motif-containing protein [Dyadobacter psychrotolerans]|uniref:LuxR family transcriptional regulator n=1 Tax=Dyadobacter psychrotolerans TaxID=2541721 RepID=A0A4R5DGS2_9BACT|nr:triple tyrosine motif-containing protein [Dyadobacter psychrotolerans]TDE11120.1 LuxR family transcriptional regulator [Dyadobacter psychrotolerans]
MNFHQAKKRNPWTSYFPGLHQVKPYCPLTLLLFFAFFSQIQAQETPPLTNYPLSVYKAHKQNWAIDQSAGNFIYAANSDGLLEFDGASWKTYTLPNHQIVRAVLCDQLPAGKILQGKTMAVPKKKTESRIYVGGYGEFGFWQEDDNGQLIYNSLSKNAGFESLKTEEIWHILKTPKYIYFQSFAFIYRYDGKNLIEIKASGNFMFMQFVNNRLLVPIIGKGLYELKGEKFYALQGTEDLSSTIVSSILPFRENQILITTTKHGLFIWKDGQLRPWKIPISAELRKNIINRAIILSQDNSFVFGTIQKGVYVVLPDGTLKYHLNKENGLQNNTVLALAEDSQKQLWIGMDQGIDLVKMSSSVISYQTNDNPLGSTYAAAIWQGNLYVGSNNGVFVKKWMSAEPFRAVPGLGGQTWYLKVIDDQLLCGHNDATFRIESDGVKKISEVTGGWTFLPVKNGKDTLLLQGAYNGLHVYKKDKQKLWTYSYRVKSVPTIPIKQIVQGKDGAFWLAHPYKGLFLAKLTSNLDSVTYWKEFESPKDIPSEFSVEITKWKNSIYIRSSDQFFVSNDKNVLQASTDFDKDADEAYKLRSGINNEWFKVFTNRVLFNTANQQQKLFDLALVSNNETIIPLTDDYYFFGLDNGYALYNRLSAGAHISNLTKPVVRKIANLRNLTETFGIASGTNLPADIRSIRIMFALPAYGQNVQFKYRLKGLSDQWSEWTDQNFVDYTNLESSNYTFEIWNSLNGEITNYNFSIAPYWRETFFAKLLLAILIACILTVLIIYQERRLVRHRRKLLDEQEEKLRQERLSSERKIMEMQNEKLQSEIKNKSQQISNVAINVVRKNEILEEIRDELKQVKLEMGLQLPNIHYQKLLNSIERNVAGKEDWQLFEENFNEVHEQFFRKLRIICPSISPSELRLAACLRMNLSTKEMAPALGISIRGVEIKRYRLRKKLGLGLDANLVQYMMDI